MADNPELESFRRKWREEVSRRSKPQATPPTVAPGPQTQSPKTHQQASHRKNHEEKDSKDTPFDAEGLAQQVGELSIEPEKDHEEDGFTRRDHHEPRSALEHFERAVEKEAAGNLGDSLQHYRKAYRLDDSVDKAYRDKHFAHVWKKPAQPAQPTELAAEGPVPVEAVTLPTNELIESFAGLAIPQAAPLIENTPPPPCPIADVPDEVLVLILREVALEDPATFGRVALVCKRMAYHFHTAQTVWKAVCQNPEFGFAGMQYTFACDILGNPGHTLNDAKHTPFPKGAKLKIPKPLSTWSQVFQSYPRIRFTGIYISTVNYTRPGAQSNYTSVSWNAPIHIVTYYRYLRFYPDGSVVSLLTTTDPVDVVPHISKENLLAARTPAHRHRHLAEQDTSLATSEHVPAVAMNALKHGHRGRWRLTPAVPLPGNEVEKWYQNGPPKVAAQSLDPRDLVVETEGVHSKYTYVMQLTLRSPSASKGVNQSKNTKLVWRGYWSYNQLTDDWAEFGLRNDRAFVFRRVRGWGI